MPDNKTIVMREKQFVSQCGNLSNQPAAYLRLLFCRVSLAMTRCCFWPCEVSAEATRRIPGADYWAALFQDRTALLHPAPLQAEQVEFMQLDLVLSS